MADENVSGTPATVETQVTNQDTVTNETPNLTQETVQQKTDWPATWREMLAGNDDKVKERLGRFNSIKDVWNSYTELEKRLSSGKAKPELPTDREPTAEEVAAYRKAYGVPETAADYAKSLDPEMVIGEEDKEAVELLFNRMHELNADPKLVKAAISTYYDIIEHQAEQAAIAQQEVKRNSEDTLRKEWGAEYRANMNAIVNLLAGAPAELRERMNGMVLGDGTLAFNNADFLRWIGSLTREINPAITVVPAGHGDPMTSVTQQLNEFKAAMAKDINAWQAPANAANRAKYLELLRAQEKLQTRR